MIRNKKIYGFLDQPIITAAKIGVKKNASCGVYFVIMVVYRIFWPGISAKSNMK